MARPLRIEYPGAWYHVMNRGWRREEIFRDDRDHFFFLDLLGKCLELFELEVHAYSLMPNHYHLLVHTPRGNLSRAMRHLNGVYTQKFNKRYGSDGVLFRGRYKSILVDADSYVLKLVQYIHRNAYEGGLEKKIGTHPWTSHGAYLREKGRPAWLQMAFVLKYFMPKPDERSVKQARKAEQEALVRLDAWVKQESPEELRKRLSGANWPALLGTDQFKEWVHKKFLGSKVDEKEKPELRRLLRDRTIRDLVRLAKEKWDYGDDSISRVRRGREDPRKRALIYASRRFLKSTTREIREAFGGIGSSAVSMQYVHAATEIKGKKGCYEYVKELAEALNCQVKT